jgi:hypothetical protein
MASLADLACAGGCAAVTPSNTTRFAPGARALYVGGGGNVAVVPADGGAAVLFSNVPAGTFLPVRCLGVNATNTTATNIVALF